MDKSWGRLDRDIEQDMTSVPCHTDMFPVDSRWRLKCNKIVEVKV